MVAELEPAHVLSARIRYMPIFALQLMSRRQVALTRRIKRVMIRDKWLTANTINQLLEDDGMKYVPSIRKVTQVVARIEGIERRSVGLNQNPTQEFRLRR